MPDIMREKLEAYLDGELDEHSQRQIQKHLETCQACQDELNELRRISQLLQAAPLPEFTPASRFTSQLMLQLPRRSEVKRPARNANFIGWLFPASILLAWVFVQVTFGVASLITFLQQTGGLGEATAWLPMMPQQTGWLTAMQFVSGNAINPDGLQQLNDIFLFLQRLAGPLLCELLLASLYLVWLVVWLQRRQDATKGNK